MAAERSYTIPLRKEFRNAPKYKRTKKAVTALRTFISKHMKADTVHVGQKLNLHMWAKGNRNPPCRVSVTTKKHEDVAYVELAGHEIKLPVTEEPKAKVKKEKSAEEKLTTAKDTVTTESKPKGDKPKAAVPKKDDKKVAAKKKTEKVVTDSKKK